MGKRAQAQPPETDAEKCEKNNTQVTTNGVNDMTNDQQHKWVDEMDSEWEDLKKVIVKIATQHHKNKLKEVGIKVDETGKIVKAVNNTYGAGIDPEAVPEMKAALKELGMAAQDCILHMTDDEKRMFYSGQSDSVSYTFTTRHKELREALQALKKAEINE